jgi:hypothetical protein
MEHRRLTSVGNVPDHITDEIADTSDKVAVTFGNAAEHNPHQDHRHPIGRRTPRARRTVGVAVSSTDGGRATGGSGG